VEEGNWWQELLERAKSVLKQVKPWLVYYRQRYCWQLERWLALGDRVCELGDVGRRLAIVSSNLEVVRKGLEILPFEKDLGISDAVSEG
jgi:hypothetical protein